MSFYIKVLTILVCGLLSQGSFAKWEEERDITTDNR